MSEMGTIRPNWGRPEYHGEEEKDVSSEELENLEMYADFENFISKAEGDPDLKKFAEQLRESVLNYAAAIYNLDFLEKSHARKDDIARADEDRMILHNGLIDKLNILSRGFSERGWDNHWREKIGGRLEITEWAQNIAKHLSEKKQAA